MSLAALVLVLASTSQRGVTISIGPTYLHELIARADLCVVGEIVAVERHTVQVQIEQLGFGEAPGTLLSVKRFPDYDCPKRWAPYAVGQRCLYFLAGTGKSAPYAILGDGGEGESPMLFLDLVRLRASDALDLFDGRATPTAPLLEEARRYRQVFRLDTERRAVEPAVSAEALAAYRASSVLADELCKETFFACLWGGYRDLAAPSPRAPELGRLDLGAGQAFAALAAWPAPDAAGGVELLATESRALALLSLDAAGGVRERRYVRRWDGENCESAVALGDLSGDGTPELALGAYGVVRVVSLDASGAVVRMRNWGLSRPERFGRSLACLGDLDGDGLVELAVGAGDDWKPGWIWLVSLDREGRVDHGRCVLDGREAMLGPLALAALGDLDGDGTPDLAVCAPAAKGSGRAGTLAVLLLARDGSVRERVTVPGDEHRGRSFGTSLAALGDWDGDGVPDLAVGAPYDVSRVLFLERDGRVKRELVLGGEALPEGAGFGRALVAVPRAEGGTRLLVAGFSAIERGARSWQWLRCYPSLWSFEP